MPYIGLNLAKISTITLLEDAGRHQQDMEDTNNAPRGIWPAEDTALRLPVSQARRCHCWGQNVGAQADPRKHSIHFSRKFGKI